MQSTGALFSYPYPLRAYLHVVFTTAVSSFDHTECATDNIDEYCAS